MTMPPQLRIKLVKELLETSNVHGDLAFIASHCIVIPAAITSLEKTNISLIEGLKIFEDAIAAVSSAGGKKG